MQYDLGEKIEEFSKELFADLGLTDLPEEQKADIYARLQDHLHGVILVELGKILSAAETDHIHDALEQEDYKKLDRIIQKFPEIKTELEEKIQKEFDNLKLIIAEEQKNAGETS